MTEDATDGIVDDEAVVVVGEVDRSEVKGSGTDGGGADGVEFDGTGVEGGGVDEVGAAETDDALPDEVAASCASFTEVCKRAVVDIGIKGTAGVESGTHCHESCGAAVEADDKIDDEAI